LIQLTAAAAVAGAAVPSAEILHEGRVRHCG
jgi:hypothetical protein